MTEASNPLLHDSCKGHQSALSLEVYFGDLLSTVRVCCSSLSAQPTRSAYKHCMLCGPPYFWELTKETIHCRW